MVPRLKWYSVFPFLLLTVLVPCYLFSVTLPGGGAFHDDALYMVLAKSLASGQGYHIISLPNELPETKYPFLYPLLLTPIWALSPSAPHNFVALKSLNVLFLAGWCLSLWFLMKRLGASQGIRGWVLALTLLSPVVFFLSGSALPDVTFACISTVAILVLGPLLESGQRGGGYRRLVVGAILVAAAFLTKTIGLALIVATTLMLASKKKWRMALVFLVICGVLVSPWLVFQQLSPGTSDAVEAYYTRDSYAGNHIFTGYDREQLLDIVIQNVIYQALTFRTVSTELRPTWHGLLFYFGLWCLFVTGFLRSLRRPTLLHAWIVVYTGIVVCWVWPPQRYQMPLWPFYVYFGIAALNGLRNFRWLSRAAITAVVGLMFLVDGGLIFGGTVRNSERLQMAAYSPYVGIEWSRVQGIATWLRDNTSSDSILTANHDPLLFLLTERKSIRAFRWKAYELYYSLDDDVQPVGTVSDLREHLVRHGIGYIVLMPSGAFRDDEYFKRLLAELQLQVPDSIVAVYSDPDPAYCVFRVNLEALR